MIWRDRLDEARVAGLFLSRLPMGRVACQVALSHTVWAWPLIGALIGLVFGGIYHLSAFFGLSAEACVILAMTGSLAASGALHEDGLADFADGLGGGADPARRLAIMRDSRLGSYGAMALILAFLLSFVLWSTTPAHAVWLQAVGLGAISRMALPLWLAFFPPARPDGLGANAQADIDTLRVATALVIGGGVAFCAFLPGAAALALIACCGVQLSICFYARARLGGISGDVMGCAQVLGGLSALLVVV